ncbi:porin PorA family protein [Frankia canadensis]|uniref:porin PorA family protein n=1 Tax=Frankia canadensis TaxID=1836972 RepID=UPI001A9C4D91|nr:porin PorA family protein [Frankia canadensis]
MVGLVGLVLLVVAVLTRFVVLPAGQKLPKSTDVSVQYTGTGTFLDANALAAGDMEHALAKDVPVSIDRRTYVKSVHGDHAIVGDDVTVRAGGPPQTNRHTYALDRTSLAGVASPDGTVVEPTSGSLPVAWPIGPSPSAQYQLYDTATQRGWPGKYLGAGSTDGRSTYRFTYVADAALKDPTVVKSLPAALPKGLLSSLSPLLATETAGRLTAALPSLPANVPISYTARTTVVAVVDQQTGLVVDTTQDQRIIASVADAGRAIQLLPVMSVKVKLTSASVTELADKAASGGRLLILIGVVAPLALAAVGLLLIIVAVIRRTRTAANPSAAGAASDRPTAPAVKESVRAEADRD